MDKSTHNSDALSGALLASKSILARLLASENIEVQHQPVPTASFDVENRVLTLPMWERMSNGLYDMLVGHEVAHALFTPNGADALWAAVDAVDSSGRRKAEAKDCLNIVEDARIERMMKDRFPGLIRDFADGYAEMHKDGIFTLETPVEEMGFADRVNIHFKLGHLLTVPFSDSEQELVDRIEAAESWDDVIACSRDLLAAGGESKSGSGDLQLAEASEGDAAAKGASSDADGDVGDEQTDADGQSSSPQGDGEGDDGTSETQTDSTNKLETGEQDGSNVSMTEAGMGDQPSSIQTANIMDRFGEDHARSNGQSRRYVTLPEVDVDRIIVKPEEIASRFDEVSWARYEDEIQSMLRDANMIAGNMAKRFEMKQAAKVAKRVQVAKTGTLDTVRMMNYKFSDDIFRRNTILPKGKNHGMIMFVDWSGSMCDHMADTLRQALYMAAFCKKIGVPFAMYGFTSVTGDGYTSQVSEIITKKTGDQYVPMINDFALLELVSSDMRMSSYKQGMRNIARMIHHFDGYYGREGRRRVRKETGPMPSMLRLGGTPLEQAILSAREIANRMRRRGVEILNMVFLTDGAAGCGPLNHRWAHNPNEYDSHRVISQYDKDLVLLDSRKQSHTFTGHYSRSTESAFNWLRNETGARIVGFYLTSRYWFENPEHDIAFKSNKYVHVGAADGYDDYFVLDPSGSKRGSDAFDSLEEDVSARKAASAFIKQAKALASVKNIMNQFAEIVAA